jgi:hypothetical protein
MLFELFYSFGTEMERVTCIKNLRQGNLPEGLKTKWPKQVSPNKLPLDIPSRLILVMEVILKVVSDWSNYVGRPIRERIKFKFTNLRFLAPS